MNQDGFGFPAEGSGDCCKNCSSGLEMYRPSSISTSITMESGLCATGYGETVRR
jgi:hypothetical protein